MAIGAVKLQTVTSDCCPVAAKAQAEICPLNPKRVSRRHRGRKFHGANGAIRTRDTIRTYAHQVPSVAEVCYAAGADGACLAGRKESDPFAERGYVY